MTKSICNLNSKRYCIWSADAGVSWALTRGNRAIKTTVNNKKRKRAKTWTKCKQMCASKQKKERSGYHLNKSITK